MDYNIIVTEEFDDWIKSLPTATRDRVESRLELISIGHFGLHKWFDGLIELKWLNGTRIYMFIWKSNIIVVLNGGNKNGQSYDIKKAKKIQNEILTGLRAIH